jgi:uncharacterized protein YidB (DUF937 family)
MGLLDTITGALRGAKGAGVNTNAVLVQQLIAMLSKPGALGNLVSAFQKQDLGNVMQSWLGTGTNLPISPAQIQQVLGSDVVADMAKKAGIGVPDAASALSNLLPQVIDKISPNGTAPEGNELGSMLASVGKLFG